MTQPRADQGPLATPERRTEDRELCDHRDDRGSTIMQATSDRYECIVCGERFRLIPVPLQASAEREPGDAEAAWEALRQDVVWPPGTDRSASDAFARHRPLIESALRDEATDSEAAKWRVGLGAMEQRHREYEEVLVQRAEVAEAALRAAGSGEGGLAEAEVERLRAIETAAGILLSVVNVTMPEVSPYGCPHSRDWLNGVLDDLRAARLSTPDEGT